MSLPSEEEVDVRLLHAVQRDLDFDGTGARPKVRKEMNLNVIVV